MRHTFLQKHLSRRLIFSLFFAFLLALTFVRLYNIDITARFTRDESSDLVRMHQYYENRKITLVGPISNSNTKVFSSLTYYMLMPFAVAGNFTPVSPAYGTAFWGVLTAILIILLVRRINKRLLLYTLPLTLFWYPLLQTSRWAWNPHLVLFWIALGIWFYYRKTTLSYFLSGITLGLSIHNHYIALIATGIFILLVSVRMLITKSFKNAAVLIGGYILPFIPFVIFDLRHPPGLFINHYLMSGNIANTQSTTFLQATKSVFNNFALFCQYVTQNYFLAIVLGISLLAVLLYDIRTKNKSLLFALPVIGQLIVGAFLDTLQTRYLLPALIFFFVWLIYPRKSMGMLFSKITIFVLILGSLLSFYPQLHFVDVHPDVRTVEKANKIIVDLINSKNIKNVNIAALGSEAPDTLGLNLRDSLQIHDIHFLAASQYDVSEQLLVLSTSDEKSLRRDQAFAMQQFKNARLGGVYPIKDSDWKIYWFKKI